MLNRFLTIVETNTETFPHDDTISMNSFREILPPLLKEMNIRPDNVDVELFDAIFTNLECNFQYDAKRNRFQSSHSSKNIGSKLYLA